MANNSNISQQLNMLAALMESSEKKDIPVTLLDTCAGLIGIVTKTLSEITVNKDEADDVFFSLTGVSKSVSSLATAIGSSPDIMPSTEVIKKLSEEKEKARNFRQEIAKAEMELPGITKENEELSHKATSLKKDYDNQTSIRDGLKASLENYTDEAFDAINEEIKTLTSEIAAKEEAKKAKENDRKDAEERLSKTKDEINVLQKKIDTYSEEEQALAKDLKEHEKAIEHLEEAKKLNTPEKQQEIKNDTAKIKATATKLNEEIARLNEEKSKAENTVCEYSHDKAVLETDILDVIMSSMAPLKDIMKAHTEKLNEIKKDAQALQKSLAEAKAIRDQYSFMLDNSVSSYKAMADAIGTDHKNLKETLDITKSGKIKENIDKAKTAIEEIDKIIAECSKACTLDNDNTVRMATSAKK